jgi:glutaryl-CoA transferase
MEGPLAGLRVVELARILAGPWAGQILADLGADVIKIESPDGDDTRQWGPPFIAEADGGRGDAAYFHCCNRGKRSIVLDLKDPDGLRAARRLAAGADVVIENFKTGGLVKFGLDYASLAAVNPRLVYCSITGFGHTGPYAARAGYDFLIQGMSGIMSVTGADRGEPQKIGVAFADIFTALYAVIAIQAALSERDTRGGGQHIDMALLDSMVGVLANQALNFLATGDVPRQLGNVHPNIAPYQVFAVADGHVILAVGNDRQFERACTVLGLHDLVDDPRFKSNADRVRHREVLEAVLAPALERRARAKILAAFEAANVPAGPINTIADVFADPQVRARGMEISAPAPWLAGGVSPGVRTPITFSGELGAPARPAPRLGQHTDEVLAEIGNGAGA